MNYLDLTDAQVLDLAGPCGPGIIGQYLFERAEWVKVHNPLGAMGPDALDRKFEPSEKAMADLESRGMVKAIEVDVVSAVVAPVPPGVESVEWESTESPTVQVVESPVKRGPGRPRKEK